MIRVLFFAQLREDLQCAELMLDSEGIGSVSDLAKKILELHPQWNVFLTKPNLRIAVNHAYAKADTSVAGDDEVAFFPPVTGG